MSAEESTAKVRYRLESCAELASAFSAAVEWHEQIDPTKLPESLQVFLGHISTDELSHGED